MASGNKVPTGDRLSIPREKRSPGRPKGAKNKIPGSVKEAIYESLVADEDPRGPGAVGYLRWLKWEEPKAYAGLLKAILPKDVRHEGDVRIVVHTGMGDSAEPGVN